MPKTETPKVDHLPSVSEILPVFDNILDDIESHVAKKKPLSQYILLQLQMVQSQLLLRLWQLMEFLVHLQLDKE